VQLLERAVLKQDGVKSQYSGNRSCSLLWAITLEWRRDDEGRASTPHGVAIQGPPAGMRAVAQRGADMPPFWDFIVGSTPRPDEILMRQVGRTLTAADEGVLSGHRVLICDRDAKWNPPVRARLGDAGIRVVQTPYQAPMRMPMPSALCAPSSTSA